MLPKSMVSAATLAALTLAACDGSPTAGAGLDQLEAENAAALWDEVGAAVMDGFGPVFAVSPVEGGAVQATTTTDFTRTRQCPAGGTSTFAGTRTVTNDPATRSGSMQLNATRTDAACTMDARRGGGTISISTTPNVAVTSNQSWTDGVPGTRTTTHKGSFTWTRSAGQSGSCTVDLTATFTPATRTYTLNGTFCNRTVSVTRTRTE